MTRKTARTWDSYKQSLSKVLDNFIPKRCFEWGVGNSTRLIMSHPAVETLDSVDHDQNWTSKFRLIVDEHLNVIYEPDRDLYPLVQGRYDYYDLIFVDGILRDRCMLRSKEKLHPEGIVILHDAERPEYYFAIKTFQYIHWTDNGSTVLVTNNKDTNDRLKEVLDEDMQESVK